MIDRKLIILALCCSYLFIFLLAVSLFLTTGEVFCTPTAVFYGSAGLMAACLNRTLPLGYATISLEDNSTDIDEIDDNFFNGTSLLAIYIRCDPRKKHRWASIEKAWSAVVAQYGIQLFFVVGRTSSPHFESAKSNVLIMDFADGINSLTEKMNGIFAHFIRLAKQQRRKSRQKVAIMLNDNIIFYPKKIIDGIEEMVPKNHTRPFIGGKVANYGSWNATWISRTWYQPKAFGEFISGFAVIVNVQAAVLFHNALEKFPVTYRNRFRLDDILITWLLADALKIKRIHTEMIGMCKKSKINGTVHWNPSLAIVHCWDIERDVIDHIIEEETVESP